MEKKPSFIVRCAMGCLGLVVLLFAFVLFIAVTLGEGPLPQGSMFGTIAVIIILCILAYYLFAGGSFKLNIRTGFLFILVSSIFLVSAVISVMRKGFMAAAVCLVIAGFYTMLGIKDYKSSKEKIDKSQITDGQSANNTNDENTP